MKSLPFGTPVRFKIITTNFQTSSSITVTKPLMLHGFVQANNGDYAIVVIPSMKGKVYYLPHSALTYDDTPEAVTPAPLPTPPISFDELISQSR